MLSINFCRWLDSNSRPRGSEATTLPYESQPLQGLFLFIFVLFQHKDNLTINGRIVDGVLGIRTLNRKMEGADESTAPQIRLYHHQNQLKYSLSKESDPRLAEISVDQIWKLWTGFTRPTSWNFTDFRRNIVSIFDPTVNLPKFYIIYRSKMYDFVRMVTMRRKRIFGQFGSWFVINKF